MIYTKVRARNKPDHVWEGVQKKEFLKRSTSPPFTHLKPHLPPPAPAHAPRVAAPNVPVGVWSPTPRGRPAVAPIELKLVPPFLVCLIMSCLTVFSNQWCSCQQRLFYTGFNGSCKSKGLSVCSPAAGGPKKAPRLLQTSGPDRHAGPWEDQNRWCMGWTAWHHAQG